VIHGKNVVVVLDALGLVDDLMSRLTGLGAAGSRSLNSSKNRATLAAMTNSLEAEKRGKLKILLAEDTNFFRRHVTSYLRAQGYEVVAVVNGEEAFKRLELAAPSEFSLVLTDIEMPILDGFELARKIRSRKEFSGIPVIALTTRFRNSDIEKGKEVGFTAYLEKFNGDTLTQTMDQLFGLQQAV
jgi:CheY-like chemotaxis protein